MNGLTSSVDLVNVHLAYDSTAGTSERQFFQNWIVDERGLPRAARDVRTPPEKALAAVHNFAREEFGRRLESGTCCALRISKCAAHCAAVPAETAK